MPKTLPSKTLNKNGVNSIIGCRTGIWFSYLLRYRIQAKYLPRVLLGTCVVLLSGPFRVWERWRLGRKIKEAAIHPSPVFILGHWRGGTTLLHNLLTQDPRFGYVSYLQGFFPHSFLRNGLFRRIAKAIMPATRPMDNMAIGIHSPQEDEMALLNQSGHSAYNMWVAPEQQMDIWRQYGLLQDRQYRGFWLKGFMALLRAASHHFGGKPLILKNPPHTARIPLLLELFPDARFIHIARNPYEVYASTYKLYRNVINFFQFHDEDAKKVNDNILAIYQEMYDAYAEGKQLIPKGNLVEIRFEDFVADKEAGLRQIYTQLRLGDYEEMASKYAEYLSGIAGYQKNKLRDDDEVIHTVNEHWSFAFELLGYEREETHTAME